MGVQLAQLADDVYGFVKMARDGVHILKGCGEGARGRGELRKSAVWLRSFTLVGFGVGGFDEEFCILVSCALATR